MNYKLKKFIKNLSDKSTILNNLYIQMNAIKVKYYSSMDDDKYAKLKYSENTGQELNLRNPETFNEKLWWLKINNRDPLMTVCSDKYLVRDYVIQKGIGEILNPLIGVYNKAEEIDFNKLPEKAFIKLNNASGINFLWDRNKKKRFNSRKFIKKFNKNLESNYYLQSREYNYKDIPPKIVVENYIKDKSNIGLIDYRFFCFDGKVKLLFVDIDVAANDGTHNPASKRNIYDKNFNLQKNVRAKRKNFDDDLVKKPVNFEKMVEYAEKLSSPFVFCRVDFYNIDGKIIFGEITFYPGGGTQLMTPETLEYEMGSWIDLSSSKIIRKS